MLGKGETTVGIHMAIDGIIRDAVAYRELIPILMEELYKNGWRVNVDQSSYTVFDGNGDREIFITFTEFFRWSLKTLMENSPHK
jgi:hypothetical protein